MAKYLRNISEAFTSLTKGLRLTFGHFKNATTMRDPVPVSRDDYFDKKDGIVTLQYPFEEIPVPDNGRYQLHNEIDDCIVCDKCAKICPVDCIDIEPVRAVEEIGKTSDGTPKRIYAAKFDIDMGKCCFCGLCTTVCPTECLTMTKDYDFSVFDITEHNFEYGVMEADEIAKRKRELEEFNAKKAAAKALSDKTNEEKGQPAPKPTFKPKMKPVQSTDTEQTKPKFKPKIKPSGSSGKPVFKPKIKPKSDGAKQADPDEAKITTESTSEGGTSKKPAFRPKIKAKKLTDDNANADDSASGSAKPDKARFKPKVKSKSEPSPEQSITDKNAGEQKQEPENVQKPKKPVFRPKIKPKKK